MLAQLEADRARRKALASAVPSGDDPNLYRWSEASEYVRLPKSLFTRIQLYDPSMDSREPQNRRIRFSPALTKDGKISSVLLEALGLDELASSKVNQAFLEFAQAYRELEKSHTLLTNTLPEGWHVDGPYQTSITPAFPEEGNTL
jgi:hypothetical protein